MIGELVDKIEDLLHVYGYCTRRGLVPNDPRFFNYTIAVNNIMYICVDGFQDSYTSFSLYKLDDDFADTHIDLQSDDGISALCNYSTRDQEKKLKWVNMYGIIEKHIIEVDVKEDCIEFLNLEDATTLIVLSALQVMGKTTAEMDAYLEQTNAQMIADKSMNIKKKEEIETALNISMFNKQLECYKQGKPYPGDDYLTDNPKISFFKVVYRRKTKFAGMDADGDIVRK